MGYLKGLRDPKGLEGSGDVGCLGGHESQGDLEVQARPAGIPTEAFVNPLLKTGPLSHL